MFQYFGYGSNMDLTSLRAKGVDPSDSVRGVLPGWELRFSVTHFFKHEGGVGNIVPAPDNARGVHGVVHRCSDDALALLDAAEAYGHGYDRVEVEVQTERGPIVALAYVGMDTFIDDRCLPTRRYLNILVSGAESAGIDPTYIRWLRDYPTHVRSPYPPFEAPAGDHRSFSAAELAAHPLYTGLCGHVFDMTDARPKHEFLKGFFGGRDMTLFHLKRLDSSDGTETEDDIRHGRLDERQRTYLNEYLQEYAAEYRYVGRYRWD